MRMLRRLAGARRPDHDDAIGSTGTTDVSGDVLGTTAVGHDHDLDDVVGHLHRPEASLAGPPSTSEAPSGSDLLAPIAGVSVDQYVVVCAGLAAHHYDPTWLPVVASEHGIDTAAWESAAAGFNARLSVSPTFARHFNALYRAARIRAS